MGSAKHYRHIGHIHSVDGFKVTRDFKDEFALATIIAIFAIELLHNLCSFIANHRTFKPTVDSWRLRLSHLLHTSSMLPSPLALGADDVLHTHSHKEMRSPPPHTTTTAHTLVQPLCVSVDTLESSTGASNEGTPRRTRAHTRNGSAATSPYERMAGVVVAAASVSSTDEKDMETGLSAVTRSGSRDSKDEKVTKETKETKEKRVALNLESVNTYDLYKVLATVSMFIDHYSYLGLPLPQSGSTSGTASLNVTRDWMRVYGRFAAPAFFFLCGFSSKRFRMRVWIGALFLYFFTAVYALRLVHVPFESILTVSAINCVCQYVRPHEVLGNWVVSLLGIAAFLYFHTFLNATLCIAYGSAPFMLAIAGDLIKHRHSHRFLWVSAGLCLSVRGSIAVFAKDSSEMRHWIIAGALLNGAIMCGFRVIELPFFNALPKPLRTVIRDGIKWLSRNGVIVYIGHLTLFRCIVYASMDRAYYY